jgi:hypothetical protein
MRATVLLFAVVVAFGISNGRAADPITIESAAWLTGRWVGQGFGGQLEETWTAPTGGQMVGHFRMVKDGKPAFYEFLLIEEHEGGLRYRVKHFNPDFVGWEEKDGFHEFSWVSGDRTELRFNGLTLRRIGDDESDHIITIGRKDGTRSEETLRYRRVRD